MSTAAPPPQTPLKRAVKRLVAESARLLGSVTHVATDEPVAALTFDDGPDPASTPRVLELLEAHGARGTFFMIGKAARRHPDLVERVAAGGHAIGNHTWSHPSLPLLRGRGRRAEMRWCREVLEPHGGRLFRPPYGHQSLGSRLDAARLGYQVIVWSVVAEDWAGAPAEEILARVEARLAPGAIVVLHDALWSALDERHRDRGPTLAALERLLDTQAGSYRFVTVPELLAGGSPRRWHHYRRSDLEWLRREL